MIRFSKGDWVLIRGGKKAHRLVQGYNGLVPRCTPMAHSVAGAMSVHVEQQDMKDGSSSERCKRCCR